MSYRPIVHADVIESLSDSEGEPRHVTYHNSSSLVSDVMQRVVDSCSDLLAGNGFDHNHSKWSMDVIRYNLQDEQTRVKSGLAWHCENDNGDNLISVLLYLRLDEGVSNGNLRYKDIHGKKQMIDIRSGTTIIMDGNVPHKPQDPYGTGRRDLIIVSFSQ